MHPITAKFRNVLPDWIVAVTRYGRSHRTVPNLIRPRTFNEKVLHRILFDRSAWMPMVADKYRVRDYVRERVGPHILPELYWVTDDPGTIPFATLPDRFVVKPTHGSGWVEIVHDKSTLDTARLLQLCRSWLRRNYYEMTREWIYKDITPRILVEEFIDDGTGASPNDYKLLAFGGRVEFILVTMGRFETRAHLLLDRHWTPVDVRIAYSEAQRAVAPPPHLREMIEAAETLARGIDFVRVDFYDTEQKLVFGELTATPGCAVDRFEPVSFDSYLGSLWKREQAA
jgi:teichuronopeptide biosynthesis TupA-like protein